MKQRPFVCKGDNGRLVVELLPLERTSNGDALRAVPQRTGFKDVAPQRFRFQVNHHEATVPKLARHRECQLLSFDFSAIHDGVMAEVSPCGGEVRIADRVVDDLT